jgi:membrane protease YdiL (CAAX protease family)
LTTVVASVLGAAFIIVPDILALRALIGSPAALNRAAQHLRRTHPEGASHGAIASVILIVTTGLWEEVTFRGIPFWFAAYGFSLIAIVIVSSGLFGLQHLSSGPASSAYSVGYGLAFFAIYLISRDLYAVIFAHCAGNLFTLFYTRKRILAEAERLSSTPTPATPLEFF